MTRNNQTAPWWYQIDLHMKQDASLSNIFGYTRFKIKPISFIDLKIINIISLLGSKKGQKYEYSYNNSKVVSAYAARSTIKATDIDLEQNKERVRDGSLWKIYVSVGFKF